MGSLFLSVNDEMWREVGSAMTGRACKWLLPVAVASNPSISCQGFGAGRVVWEG